MDYIQKHRNTIYSVLITLLFASYPISLAANSITTGLIIFFYFFDSLENIKKKISIAFKNKFVWLSIIYCLVQGIGLLYTNTDMTLGLNQLNHSLPFLIMPIIALSENLDKKNYNRLLLFIKYITISIMLFYILYHVFITKSPLSGVADFTINRISSTSQIYTSGLCLIAVFITAKQLLNKEQILLNSCFLVFLVYTILLLSSRIVILAFLISVIVLIYKNFGGISVYKRITLIGASMIILSISIYNIPRIKSKIDVLYKTTDFNMEVILTKNSITRTKNTVEHRFLVYYTAAKSIIKALPFGYGTGDYQEVLNKGYDDINFKIGIEQKFNTHNQYLEEFLKTGILGGITLLLLTIALIQFVKFNDNLVFAVVTLTIIGCLFDSFLARQHGAIFVSFFVPLFYSQLENNFKKSLN